MFVAVISKKNRIFAIQNEKEVSKKNLRHLWMEGRGGLAV